MSIQPFSITTQNQKDHTASFVIEPLPQGYGDTLGNSLRRVLYTSIPGAAITSIRISNAPHQFTSLPGVMEDVLQIVLNLKQVHIAYSGDKPAVMSLVSKGQTEVKAADFELPSGVTIANPDMVIAHLTDKSAKLDIEATVESGFGYSPADDRKTSTVGTIIIDATFTPVLRVNYQVEATRVGRITNYDKLTLTVSTDGTITPADAVTTAAKTLVEYFSSVATPSDNTPAPASSSSSSKGSVGNAISVEELDLPTRIANALQKAGLNTVSDIQAIPRDELSKIKNLGGKSVQIIEEALIQRGYSLSV